MITMNHDTRRVYIWLVKRNAYTVEDEIAMCIVPLQAPSGAALWYQKMCAYIEAVKTLEQRQADYG